MHLRFIILLALSSSTLPMAIAEGAQNEAFEACCRANGVSKDKIDLFDCCNYETYHESVSSSTPAKSFVVLAIDPNDGRECLDASGSSQSNRRRAERGAFLAQPSRYGYGYPLPPANYYPVGPPSHAPTKATPPPHGPTKATSPAPTQDPSELDQHVNIAVCMFENGDRDSTVQCCNDLNLSENCAQICNVSLTATVVKSAKWWSECGYALSRLANCGYVNAPTAGGSTDTPISGGIAARTKMIHGVFALLALYVAFA